VLRTPAPLNGALDGRGASREIPLGNSGQWPSLTNRFAVSERSDTMPKRSDATDRSAVLEPPDVEQKSFGLVNNELRGLVHVGMDTAVRKLRLIGLVYLRNDGGRYAERPQRACQYFCVRGIRLSRVGKAFAEGNGELVHGLSPFQH
jgi:hypothetical protein